MTEIQTPPEGTEQEPVIPQIDPEIETPTPETPSEAPETPVEQPSPEPQPTAPDYKQKFVDSQREAILLAERNKAKEAQLESLTKQDTPTDEAMRQLYPEWDTFTDITKQAFVGIEAQNMRQARIESQQRDISARQQLDDKLEEFLETPPEAFKKITGKEAEFKRFAKKKNNIGLSLETLAKAFLFDAEEETPPTPMREALPAGSGGPRDPLKPKKISSEEASKLRTTDYKRWLELVKADATEEVV